MSTLSAPAVKAADAQSEEKRIYTFIETFAQYIPVANDRNRLAYSFIQNEKRDPVLSTVKTNKLQIEGISEEELAQKIEAGLKTI